MWCVNRAWTTITIVSPCRDISRYLARPIAFFVARLHTLHPSFTLYFNSFTPPVSQIFLYSVNLQSGGWKVELELVTRKCYLKLIYTAWLKYCWCLCYFLICSLFSYFSLLYPLHTYSFFPPLSQPAADNRSTSSLMSNELKISS